jgi:hypothetical protein
MHWRQVSGQSEIQKLIGPQVHKLTSTISILVAASFEEMPAFAEQKSMPDQYERVAAGLNDYLDYCIDEAERAGTADVEQPLHLGPNVIRDLLVGDNRIVVLDASAMRCEHGGYGHCGSAGCSIWVFTQDETYRFNGELYLKESLAIQDALFLCEPNDETLKSCRRISDLIE